MRDSYRSDRLLVVDVELTCWETPEPPAGQIPEPIELAVVELDTKALRVARTGRWLLRPARSAVSPFCTELTGIEPGDLARRGRPFDEVARAVARDFGTARKTWASWGLDVVPLEAAAVRHGSPSPFGASFLDLAHLFGMLAGTSRRIGLEDALAALGLVFEGRRHSALDDARNAARVYLDIARRLREGGLALPSYDHGPARHDQGSMAREGSMGHPPAPGEDAHGL